MRTGRKEHNTHRDWRLVKFPMLGERRPERFRLGTFLPRYHVTDMHGENFTDGKIN
jgi:hypothetical protein